MWETVPWELSRQQDSCENRDLQERSATIHRTWRKKFLDKLHAAGIHMEKVPGDLTSNFYPAGITAALLCESGGGMPCRGGPRMGGEPGLAGSRAGAWSGMCLCPSPLGQLCQADPHQRGVTPVPPAGTCTGAGSLISAGVPFSQQHMTHMEKKVVHYLLLSAPWSVLCYYAEELQLRVPLQVRGCGA